MLKTIKLEKQNIVTSQFYENIKIQVEPDFWIILSKEAADELRSDLTALEAMWQDPHAASTEEMNELKGEENEKSNIDPS